MNNKQTKLESPARMEELKPLDTLSRIGFKKNQTLCDIGAGSGIFTIPAALYTESIVYALEKDKEMLSIIDSKIKQNGITNVRLIEVSGDNYDVEDEIIDIALMVTVLHEIDNKPVILKEVKRMLKPEGKLAVVEFHKRQTPVGPPIPHRIAQEEVTALLVENGFVVQDTFDLGDNLYCALFKFH